MKVYKMGPDLGIYFPKAKQIYKKGDLLLLTINKSYKEAVFIVKFNYNVTLRKKFAKYLKLKKDEIINVKIKKIKNIKRTKRLFRKNKIDLLSLIPEKTSQGYKIIAYKFLKGKEEWIHLWYSHSRGSGRQIEIRRFVDIEKFGNILGQYQAEGTKHKKTKKKFYLEFSNKLVQEHVDYLSYLRELGICKKDLDFRFSYNPLKTLNAEINRLLKEFNRKVNLPLKISKNYQQKGKGFKSVIRNTIIAEIILGSMDKIRKRISENKEYNKNDKLLVDAFFAKLLTGDGTIDVRINKREYNCPSTRIKIIDHDRNYQKDYRKMMENLNFMTKVSEKHIFVRAHCGFFQLLYLYQINAFKNTNNWNKLLVNIDLLLQGRRLSTLKRYQSLIEYGEFETKKVAKDYNLAMRSAHTWLTNAKKSGYITKVSQKKSHGPVIWATTEKAKKLAKTLELWQQDLLGLKKEKGVQDSLNLLNSLKIR